MATDTLIHHRPAGSATDTRILWWGVAIAGLLTALIALTGGRLESATLLPDQGATWYFWKLAEPTFWTQATAWGGYVLHQLFLWGTIIYAKRTANGYSSRLQRVNIIALAGNAAFIVLHWLQSQLFYDGLAQNVSLQSSEASVVLLLVIVLIMENRRRGLFFGKAAPIQRQVVDFFRHNHAYIFAWAIVYTFWFHPMVNTPGHLVGFFYIFLLLLQGSLFYTKMHLNRWWTVALELIVLAHGAMVVAMLRGTALWAFVLGFLGLFLITQMHGLKLPRWAQWSVLGVYLAAIAAAFTVRGPLVVRDMLFIPILEYVLVLILALLMGAVLWVARRVRPITEPRALEGTADV